MSLEREPEALKILKVWSDAEQIFKILDVRHKLANVQLDPREIDSIAEKFFISILKSTCKHE